MLQSNGQDSSFGGEPDSNSFYDKLVTLNSKISVFKKQFYNRKPRQCNYDKILKARNMNFDRFKELFGYEGNDVRQIKVGNDTILVDNKNFTYQN